MASPETLDGRGERSLARQARGAMTDDRGRLRALVEQHALGAQREALARVNDGENDDLEDNRLMTVGDAT